MLKCKLTAAEHAALPEALRSYYKQSGENYLLQTDEAADLIAARDREKQRADGLQGQVTGLTKQVGDLNVEKAAWTARNGDTVALEASWKAKVQAVEADRDTRLAAKDKQLQQVLVVKEAEKLATKMAGSNAHLLAPVIQLRLAADTTGDNAVTRVLDAQGKPSALTLDEFEKELRDSKKYDAILIASHASGSATTGNNPPRPSAVPKDKAFKDLTEQERKDWFKADPAGFEQAAAAARRVV
jgi:hypothetical protein